LEARNQAEQGRYLVLARELNEDVTRIRELYRVFDLLLKEQSDLTAKRADLHNKLNQVEDPTLLRDDLIQVNGELDWQHEKLEAKRTAIDQAELSLQDLLPKAQVTAQRLYLAIANHTVQSCYVRLREQIHASMREQYDQTLIELSVCCNDAVNIRALAPPQVPFLALPSPNGDKPLFESFPTAKKDKMLLVTSLAEQISDKLISMLDRVDGVPLTDLRVPPYLLGAEPEPVDEPLAWEHKEIIERSDRIIKQQLDIRRQNRIAAGLNPDDPLTPQDEQILENLLSQPTGLVSTPIIADKPIVNK
jgi:hypothetical protein